MSVPCEFPLVQWNLHLHHLRYFNKHVISNAGTCWRHQMEKNLRNWPFVRGIHRWPVNSPHKGQWRGALMFSLICTWTSGWVNHRDTGNLRRHRAQYDVTILIWPSFITSNYHFTSRYFGGLKQELWDNIGTMSLCSIQFSSCQTDTSAWLGWSANISPNRGRFNTPIILIKSRKIS